MPQLVRDPHFDSSLDLLREGNGFIMNRCRKFGTDAFICRLLFKKTVCISGSEAARTFYEKGRMTRTGAIPQSVLRLLQDHGSVATLDDQQHQQRKALFMAVLAPEKVTTLEERVTHHWRLAAARWKGMAQVDLLKEIQIVLGKSAFEWCGIRLSDTEAASRIAEIATMIENAGSIGVGNWRASIVRSRTERCLRRAIEKTPRNSQTTAGTPLQRFLQYRERGKALPGNIVAVEMLNLVRPIIAVAWFVRFAALALFQNPECRDKILAGPPDYIDWFVQEVRRFYPFFPFIGARAREAFQWHDWKFAAGTRFLLDVYGTNHDPRVWKRPEVFMPERFQDWQPDPYDMIPQGGGSYSLHHRCPGEATTILLTKRLVLLLVKQLKYNVRPGDYSLDLTRIPAAPRSPFIIRNVASPTASAAPQRSVAEQHGVS